jgi:hypothetical protein
MEVHIMDDAYHYFFTAGLIISTFWSFWQIGNSVWSRVTRLRSAEKKTDTAAAKAAPATAPVATAASTQSTEKPVCWRVRVSVEEPSKGASVFIVTATSRRKSASYTWHNPALTLLEVLETGVVTILPHVLKDDRLIVTLPVDAQMAFEGLSDEPHDEIVAARIKTLLEQHGSTFKLDKEVKGKASASQPKAAPEPAPVSEPVLVSSATQDPAPQRKAQAPVAPVEQASGALPHSSDVFAPEKLRKVNF